MRMTPDRLRAWLMATRPKTLTLSLAPVAVGAALAHAAGGAMRWSAVVVALLASAAIQIGTNLHNDAADFFRGADGPDRLGPLRVTAAGLLGASEVERGAALSFALAALSGLYLVWLGGAPILLLGLASILCGWAYSSGPKPISHTPLAEIFVLAFFGVAAVGGTCWLAAGRLDSAALIGGAALGLFAAAVLLVNNHRDRIEDARNGRKMLAILLGPQGSGALYAGLMLAPFALLAPLGQLLPSRPLWIALAALPFSLALVRRFLREPVGPGLNLILAQTARGQAIFAALLCLGVSV